MTWTRLYDPDRTPVHWTDVIQNAARNGWAAILVGQCSALIVFDVRHNIQWMWGYIVGAKLVIIGGSFLIRGLIGLHEHRA